MFVAVVKMGIAKLYKHDILIGLVIRCNVNVIHFRDYYPH